jgi:hypothetical protein
MNHIATHLISISITEKEEDGDWPSSITCRCGEATGCIQKDIKKN